MCIALHIRCSILQNIIHIHSINIGYQGALMCASYLGGTGGHIFSTPICQLCLIGGLTIFFFLWYTLPPKSTLFLARRLLIISYCDVLFYNELAAVCFPGLLASCNVFFCLFSFGVNHLNSLSYLQQPFNAYSFLGIFTSNIFLEYIWTVFSFKIQYQKVHLIVDIGEFLYEKIQGKMLPC